MDVVSIQLACVVGRFLGSYIAGYKTRYAEFELDAKKSE